MRLAVTGAGGMLGRDLLPFTKSHDTLSVTRENADLAVPEQLAGTLTNFRPEIVLHLAAYTDVDGCERDPERARRDNAVATRHLAEWCASNGARLLFVSTDYVFDGTARSPIPPDAPISPINAYGRSKAEGEEAVRAAGGDTLIVRTSWLIGRHGRNFVEAIRSRARSGEPLSVVDDQRGSPTFTFDVAPALLELALGVERGTLHLANSGECTWYDLAVEILRQQEFDNPIRRATTAEIGRPAARPAYSVLDCTRAYRVLGRALPSWQDALGRYLALPAPSSR